jgi:hypothetical protein
MSYICHGDELNYSNGVVVEKIETKLQLVVHYAINITTVSTSDNLQDRR